MAQTVSPQGTTRRTIRRRSFRMGLCACCCALATSARAQDTQKPAPPPASNPSAFVPEIVPVGSDVEAAPSGWRRVLGSINSDVEGPTLRAGSVVAGGGLALGGHWREGLADT